jgi:hypothetical protein
MRPVAGRSSNFATETCVPLEPCFISHPPEIGAFGDCEAVEVEAQTVEAELDDPRAHAVALGGDAQTARLDVTGSADYEVEGPAETNAVGPPLVSIRTASAWLAPVSWRAAPASRSAVYRLMWPEISAPSRPNTGRNLGRVRAPPPLHY